MPYRTEKILGPRNTSDLITDGSIYIRYAAPTLFRWHRNDGERLWKVGKTFRLIFRRLT